MWPPPTEKLLGQRQTDGCADVGPTLAKHRNAIWVLVKTFFEGNNEQLLDLPEM